MTMTDWNNLTNYMDTVGVTPKTFSFNKTQNFVRVTTRGNANVSYTIGSQSGTLTPGQSVSVAELITSFTLTAVSGSQTIEVWSTEYGTEKVEDNGISLDDVTASLAESTQQTYNQTKRAVAPYKYDGAIFTFCDDDCQSPFMTKMKPIFDGKGIKATLGVITGNVGTSDAFNSFMTLDQLKSLKTEGYDIVCHSKTHDPAKYKAAQVDLSTVSTDTIDSDLKDSWQWCMDNGFGYETLIWPYGGFTPNTQTLRYKSIARKYFKYAMNAFGNHNDTPVDNMYMNRYYLNSSQDFTTVLKPIIDTCITKKGWLVFYTHSQENVVDATYMNTVIDYINSQNAPILTFSEGVKYKGNAFAAGEYTDAQNKFYLSNDGNHITGSRLLAETYDNTLDMTRTPSQFKNGVTLTSIVGGKDTITGQGGDLLSYIPPAADGSPAGDFCYQTFTPYNKSDVYMRKWVKNSSAWGTWSKLSTYYTPAYDSTVLMDNLITTYSTGTTLTAIANSKDTLTSQGGDLLTYAPPASDGSIAQDFGYQLFTPYNFNRMYMRKWLKVSATWGAWEVINGAIKKGTAAPTTNAEFIGQDFIDTTNKKVYKAVATGTGSLDWVVLN